MGGEEGEDGEEEEDEVEGAVDGGGGQEGEEQEESGGQTGTYNAKDVNDSTFEELRLGPGIADEVQAVWAAYLRTAESREAAGEAIYAALFDAAPSLQSLFKTPRAVMAMRFMNGLNQIILSLNDPKALKIVVETLGFQHLDLEVTIPRVVIFREAIVDLLTVDMGSHFTKKARDGWCTFLNYVGGAYIYVRIKFADRLKILASSWATANNQRAGLEEAEHAEEGEEAGEEY